MAAVHTLSDEEVRSELNNLISDHGLMRPTRSAIDETRPWLHGTPNYDRADLLYFRGKLKNHAEGSLEWIVENTVKIWEMEGTHLTFKDWKSVDHSSYRVCANGSKTYEGEEGPLVGNYNWLLAGADKRLYDSGKETFESSHETFRGAFLGGFPWEVLEVLSPPPIVAFSWRHWAEFQGSFRGREGDGKLYEMYGFGVVTLTEGLKISDIQIYYKPDEFLKAMHGEIQPEALNRGQSIFGSGCPFLSGQSK